MMTHEEASLILVDRFLDRLDAKARAGVDDHAASCEACAAALGTLGRLAGSAGNGGPAGRPAHLAIDRIVAMALETEGTAAPGDPDRRHLETCAACAAEAGACRASVLEARAGRIAAEATPPRGLRPFVPATLAAALLAGILGYPAYRGLVDLPRARRQAEASAASEERSRTEAAALRAALEKERAAAPVADEGEVGLALYLAATRGAPGRTPAIEPRPGARTVTILLEPVVSRSTPAGGPLRCEIRARAGGRVVWSGDLPAAAARDRQGAADRLVAVLVPAQALPPGEYVLALGRSGRGGAEKLMQAPFEILASNQRQSP